MGGIINKYNDNKYLLSTYIKLYIGDHGFFFFFILGYKTQKWNKNLHMIMTARECPSFKHTCFFCIFLKKSGGYMFLFKNLKNTKWKSPVTLSPRIDPLRFRSLVYILTGFLNSCCSFV